MEQSQWQSLMRMGNEFFHEQEWEQAESIYSEVYDTLAHQYRNSPCCAETLMAWVCVCHNLSSLYEETGNIHVALRFLMVPHEYLSQVTQLDNVSEDAKLIAMKGMSITLPPILMFAKKHPMCDECKSQYAAFQEFTEHEPIQVH